MTSPSTALPAAPAGQAPHMRFASDRHYEAATALSTLTIASRLPRTLRQAAALAWQADRTAVVLLLAGQVTGAVLTALALAATAHVLGALMNADDIVQGLRGNLSALLVLAGASAGRYLVDAFARAAAARLAPKVTREADLKVITAATSAELVAYEDPDFDNAYAAAGDGAEKTRDLILDAQALTSALAQLVAAAAVASVLHPLLIPLLLLAVAPCAWGAVRAARIEHAAHHRNLSDTRLRAVFRNYSTERTTADEVRANTMAAFLIRQYRVVSGRLEAEQLTASRRALVVQGAGDALSAAGMLLTWAALVAFVATDRMDLAVAGTAALAVRTSGNALSSLVRAGARLFRTSLALDDWARFLTLAGQWTGKRGTRHITAAPQVITARTASFTYPGADAPSLTDIDLTVHRGEVIALVGENGSGKTTLSKLLTGLFLPTAGTVSWDAHDLADCNIDTVLRQVAVVPQDYTRWPLAARENITLGQPRPEGDSAVHAAAEAAGADSVIARLPQGLDTSLARSWWGGHDVSGGQWQRLAVARAFHRDAPVLVLDEPTAALDARAEHRIFTRLRELASGRTTIFITHRLVNTKLADRIYVLDQGRIVQSGTFDELVSEGTGLFHEMLKLQEDR
ncbi:ATP-binding cassette domain-containing protein [Streptomyces fradiae]|uniref:ATP-binding cassette domain-containing protein n=1 Tax=Streptomyces fradiae TaxID=1906 RepID=UPI0029436842|nr:ATP-binding cassette domain-containing protein [Streptomyces fradiae]WOI60083.1 ATP-binding cassette domain-containing protein [Streptomyces fradiae]